MPFSSSTGLPSVHPELMIRMLLIGKMHGHTLRAPLRVFRGLSADGINYGNLSRRVRGRKGLINGRWRMTAD